MMFLGIEIGGTKLQLGVSDGSGIKLLDLVRFNVNRLRGAAGIREQIQQAAPILIARHSIQRIGFGFGGPINSATGVIIKSHQVEGWEDFPLAAWCQQTLGRPVAIGNDCDCAALAEARFGAGCGAASVFYVTVGTGIGGGFVVNGQLHGQGRQAASEIGHLRPGLDADHPEMTVESLAAGPAIETAARKRVQVLSNETITAKRVAEAAANGDLAARAVLNSACQALGWAIAQTITLLAPETVVIGGGVSLIGEELFFEPLRKSVAAYVFPPLANSYRIVPAGLGELAVVYGAIAIAADQ